MHFLPAIRSEDVIDEVADPDAFLAGTRSAIV